uniref:Uncharacterized protein n=1 Tax=Magallana gigas TaxID=29159 RepID=K1QAS4_MAGGI
MADQLGIVWALTEQFCAKKELTVNDLDKSKRKTLVNSQILSLTTQPDLGVLDPPLNLMFGHKGVCVAITAIIHYLFLVTFFSMLGLGVYYFMGVTVTYYALYVANNFKSKSRVCWFLGGIWGIPVIITVTNLGAFWGQGYHLKSSGLRSLGTLLPVLGVTWLFGILVVNEKAVVFHKNNLRLD